MEKKRIIKVIIILAVIGFMIGQRVHSFRLTGCKYLTWKHVSYASDEPGMRKITVIDRRPGGTRVRIRAKSTFEVKMLEDGKYELKVVCDLPTNGFCQNKTVTNKYVLDRITRNTIKDIPRAEFKYEEYEPFTIWDFTDACYYDYQFIKEWIIEEFYLF